MTVLVLVALPLRADQQDQSPASPAIAPLDVSGDLPDLPAPQTPSSSPVPKPNPCAREGVSPSAAQPGEKEFLPPRNGGVHPAAVPCTTRPLNWYQRFVNGPQDIPLTPSDKGWLAVRNLLDPFTLITIGGEGAISVAADSHSAYGPGMPGFARYVGVSFTQDMTGEFFGTFAIPSVARQDPHYHRMEGASIRRRIGHAMAQVVWTQGDSGKMMPNYANVVGFAIEDEIANLYVPGRRTNAPATAARYAASLATAPIGNLVNEFLPDVASHIHVQIIVLQKIINQVAEKETMNSTGASGGFSE
ncbi:MAG TPA: hypothetical protein VKB38_16830 [Terracidiphilus sp.]|nr:hypothetical protein [Terracidiphilus sp.]